jgi:protein SCO1/2
MKPLSLLGVCVTLSFVAALPLACRTTRTAAPEAAAAPAAAAPAPVAAAAPTAGDEPSHPLSDASIYDLSMHLLDQTGTTIGLDAFRGHPTLVVMFYASCPSACPRLVEELRTIVAAVPADRRAELRVLMVSFDAVRDTPARLEGLGNDPQPIVAALR